MTFSEKRQRRNWFLIGEVRLTYVCTLEFYHCLCQKCPMQGCVLVVEAASSFIFFLFCGPDCGLTWLNYNSANSLSLL